MIVNSANMNSVPINRIVINTVGGIGNKNNNNIPALSPIASYRNYDRTNDDEDRDMLIDLTGNGHHIKLYNWGFAGGYGYGLYPVDFNQFGVNNPNNGSITKKYNQIIVTAKDNLTANLALLYFRPLNTNTWKLKTDKYGVTIKHGTEIIADIPPYSFAEIKALTQEQINDILYVLIKDVIPIGETLILEQVPYYKGSLVSDGVDDYGLCSKPFGDVGTIVLMLDEINWQPSNFLYDAYSDENNRICGFKNTNGNIYCGLPSVVVNKEGKFIVHNTGKINTISTSFNLFCQKSNYGFVSVALYAMEIYSKILTDEEIAQVKSRMIAEYEEKTGDRYDETGALIADYEAYDKTNEDDSRAVLEDLTDNGHDINLYNFGFTEGSGYGKYATDFSKFYNQFKDYNIVTNSKFIINYAKAGSIAFNYTKPVVNCKIKVKGLTELINKGELVQLSIYESSNTLEKLIIKEDGEYIINYNNIQDSINLYIFPKATSAELELTNSLIIEQIPDYKGALVSDGVDDCGLCENFPILEVEKGLTILGIRKLLNSIEDTTAYHVGLISIGNNDIHTEFFGAGNITVKSFLKVSNINEQNIKGMFLSMTSAKYNNTTITKGTANTSTNNIHLFCDVNRNYKANTALYALKIYNRDLTDEEIEKEKAKMIKRYEEKTGEKYTE